MEQWSKQRGDSGMEEELCWKEIFDMDRSFDVVAVLL
jgi:hypothetical protein